MSHLNLILMTIEKFADKHNDKFVKRPDGRLGTSTNWSGGVQGGITNGEDIYFRWVVQFS